MKNSGLYIHIPFCAGKCPYCDFYSSTGTDTEFDEYVLSLLKQFKIWGEKLSDRIVDTVYFGGGTPSLLGGKRIETLLNGVNKNFNLANPEITVECNPSTVDDNFFKEIKRAGVNRISMGMQSAVSDERKSLGRRGTAESVISAVTSAQNAGIENISLDLMLGVPRQTSESLTRSISFCIDMGVRHISAYILKIEEGTQFYKKRGSLILPDEDETCDMYLQTCEELERAGFMQYEISNFSLPGYESRHNLKYWNAEEYLGIGPSAHSFVDGKRFFYPRNRREFIESPTVVNDGSGGDFAEYMMLRLRLSDGLREDLVREKFGISIPQAVRDAAQKYVDYDYLKCDNEKICFTRNGFLLSNPIIADLEETL